MNNNYRKQYYHLFINDLDTFEALDECRNILDSSSSNLAASTLSFINAHCFNLSVKNKKYCQALWNSNIVLNDGVGIKLGGMLKGIKFKENMNGTDFIPKLIKLSAEENKGIFLLGGKENVAEDAALKLKKIIPNVRICGTRNGYFNSDKQKEVIESINQSNAELLIVGMGVPKQEIWLHENLSNLKSVKLAVAGGAVLDFISENAKRAPLWMQNNGLEWLFRFFQEPDRLLKRYLWGNFYFFINVFIKYFHRNK